jgi:hypothetical protein
MNQNLPKESMSITIESFDKYRRKVASFIVLGDENSNWRPAEFGYEIFGCQVNFSFPS